MKRIVWTAIALVCVAGGLPLFPGIQLDASAPAAHEGRHGARFTVDVAMDGRTWRMNDGTNPFYPLFTGDLMRGKTFIVSGRIYPRGTLAKGGDFGGTANPAGPELPNAIGTWVCRGTFNLDIADIAAGGFPHVTSTQVFTFENGGVIVTEGPEGGADAAAFDRRRRRTLPRCRRRRRRDAAWRQHVESVQRALRVQREIALHMRAVPSGPPSRA